MKFKVLREHHGDKDYKAGDERNADPADVAHLVEKGVLAAPKTKAEPAPQNKAAKPADNKAAQ